MTDTASRRSFFLVLMALVANLYLVAFTADALLSLADETLRAASGNDALSALRNFLAVAVILASLPILPILLFVPQLPKLSLLPPALFALWAAIGAPPLLPSPEDATMLAALIVGQVVLAAAAFGTIWLRTGHWLLRPAALPYKRHLVLRTIAAVIVAVVALPVVLGALGLMLVASIMEQQSSGFIDFTGSGIDIQERVLAKEGKTVHLIGMMHIGEPRFYAELFASVPSDALILAEGVTDRETLLSNDLSYQRVARVLGLEQQPALLPGAPAQPSGSREPETELDEETDAEESPAGVVTIPGRPDVRYADMDLSDFSPVTIRFLNVAAALYGSSSIAEATQHFDTLINGFTEDELQTVMSDILEKRNAAVLAAFDEEINDYDTLVIPWGALHMPGIEKALHDRGFVDRSKRTIPLMRYETILRRVVEPN